MLMCYLSYPLCPNYLHFIIIVVDSNSEVERQILIWLDEGDRLGALGNIPHLHSLCFPPVLHLHDIICFLFDNAVALFSMTLARTDSNVILDIASEGTMLKSIPNIGVCDFDVGS